VASQKFGIAQSRERAKRQRDRVGDQESEDREFERRRQPLQDLGSHGDAILERRSEVAVQGSSKPFRVLNDERAIEAVQRFEAHDCLRRRVDPESGPRRRARHDIDRNEKDYRRREQRRHKQG
jgi:hypothetical protein